MKILVLGGYGFIGSHICQQLKAEGHTIGVIDCYHQYYTFPDWEYHPVLNQRKSITGADKARWACNRHSSKSYSLRELFSKHHEEVLLVDKLNFLIV